MAKVRYVTRGDVTDYCIDVAVLLTPLRVTQAIGADCAADYECGFDFETNHMTGTAIAGVNF